MKKILWITAFILFLAGCGSGSDDTLPQGSDSAPAVQEMFGSSVR